VSALVSTAAVAAVSVVTMSGAAPASGASLPSVSAHTFKGSPTVSTLTTAPGGNGKHSGSKPISPPKSGYIVYWDQDEEEDYYASATGTDGQLETPWDPNGQMCIVPHTNGEYVVGYDPTNTSQHNPGQPPGHPFKDPPIGEELQNRYGVWTGTNLYVPGPFALKKGEPGDDSPKKNGVFNGQATYTGCATDSKGDVFATDLGSAQGTYPPPADGRLVEWFAPNYRSYCILDGPTAGGVGTHHVDGTGGLSQPGMMAVADNGDLLLPIGGPTNGQGIGGEVLRIAKTSLPTGAAQCPDGIYPQGDLHTSVFVQGTPTFMPVPMGIAEDPTCDCFAVDTAFGTPAIAFYSQTGKLLSTRPTIPGETISELGKEASGFNPFGMAFAPTGTLYFVDIHLSCPGTKLTKCGPGNFGGRIMRVTFGAGNQPQLPPTVVASDFDFPTSVTVCDVGHGVCPFPAYRTPAPSKEDKAEAGG
jgi:hypothetical protein